MINKLTRHLGQKYRDDHRPRTQPQLLANMLHLTSDGNFIHSSAGRPRMFVSLHTRYWAGPFPLYCWNPGQNWPTHIYILFLIYLLLSKFFTGIVIRRKRNCSYQLFIVNLCFLYQFHFFFLKLNCSYLFENPT